MLIDTHCHVHFHAYKEDMDRVIERTLAKGVRMITVGTQKDTSAAGLETAKRYEGVWAAVGLHPNHLTRQEFWDDDELAPDAQPVGKIKTRSERFDPAYYQALASDPKCVAIGECGLDWYRIPQDAVLQDVQQLQEETVRAHFALATQMDLPVIIHCRDAHARQAELIEEAIVQGGLARRGVIHCFTGTQEEAERYLALGFYLSFSGVVTFDARRGEADAQGRTPLQRVLSSVPSDRLLLETDAPYLTPQPHRGERNEPWYVQFVAQRAAQLRGATFEEIAEQTTQNAQTLFGLDG